ncbi:MAG: hypothetical protein J5850_04400 [Clostridia bacterium]|nr:hypothetical protein [Clostridia bacterium]
MAYYCCECGKELDVNERALNLRIVNRKCPDSELKCPGCLALKYKTTEAYMREMIYRFRKYGCTLFSPLEKDEGNDVGRS